MIASVLSMAIIQYVITPYTPSGMKFFFLCALKSSALSRNEFEDTSKKKLSQIQFKLYYRLIFLFSFLHCSNPRQQVGSSVGSQENG